MADKKADAENVNNVPPKKVERSPRSASSAGGSRRGGLMIVGLFSLAAALAGGAMGAAAAWHFDKDIQPAGVSPREFTALKSGYDARIEGLERELAAARQDVSDGQARIEKLEVEIEALRSSQANGGMARPAPMGVAVVEMEPPKSAEEAPASPSEQQTEVMTGRVPMSAEPRIKTSKDDAPATSDLPLKPDAKLGGEELPQPKAESQAPIEAATPASSNNDEKRRAEIIASFPDAALFAAIPAEPEQGGIKGLWRKHVQSGSDTAAADRAVIMAAKSALQRGDISEALAQLKLASPAVQDAANDWVARAQLLADKE